MNNKDPICGNCGNPLSKHYHEDEEYCNKLTNGDIFTDDPNEIILIEFIKKKHPRLYKLLLKDWTKYAGHKK